MAKSKGRAKRPIINFVLDRSGSMGAIKAATIDLFNEYLSDNRNARWTLTQFDSEGIDTLYTARKGEEVEELNPKTYQPRSMTPLYDAIGQTLRKLDDYLKGQNGSKRKVVVAIMTDGWENASEEYTHEMIFKLIREREEMGWQFIYLGANQDAYVVSRDLGIHAGASLTYSGDDASVAAASVGTRAVTQSYMGSAMGQTVSYHEDVSTTQGPDEEGESLT